MVKKPCPFHNYTHYINGKKLLGQLPAAPLYAGSKKNLKRGVGIWSKCTIYTPALL